MPRIPASREGEARKAGVWSKMGTGCEEVISDVHLFAIPYIVFDLDGPQVSQSKQARTQIQEKLSVPSIFKTLTFFCCKLLPELKPFHDKSIIGVLGEQIQLGYFTSDDCLDELVEPRMGTFEGVFLAQAEGS